MNQNNLKKEQKESHWGWVLIVIIAICLILFFIASKDRERKLLEELSETLNRRINMIHASLKDKQRQFKRAYLALKTLFIVLNVFCCFSIYYYTKNVDFFSYISNCVNVYASFGLLLLFACFIFESDPLSLFHLRDIIKANLNKFFFKELEQDITTLPILKKELEYTNEQIKKLDSTNNENFKNPYENL